MSKAEDELNEIRGLPTIVGLYAAAKSRIFSILTKADRDAWTRGPDGKMPGASAAFWSSRISEIRKINNQELKPQWGEFTANSTPREYERGVTYGNDAIPKELRNSRATPPGRAKKIASIAKGSSTDMGAGLDQGLETIRKWARSSQQDILLESVIDRAVSEASSVRQLKSKLTKKFEEALGLTDGSGGRTITINGRNYQIDKYAEMLARTKSRQAQSLGTMESCGAAGVDLVRISSHNTTTPVCIPHEGRVYSISGKSDIYPILREIPGFHPNCLHVMTPFIAAPADTARGQEQLAADRERKKKNAEKLKAAA